ncbi:MAG: murein biosynthesis integral membrane protein MurJ [Archangium gephyra]|uniref:Probable lipid II flippase MurJ n=1 Tax=Archangium gephyra TaxID=48 RepID=A0A2W5SY33_9BACT|nr:MAG: murein biosynthesis integral membrane protein MurJ [Archangium gephyra]
MSPPPQKSGRSAALVAAGILLSRLVGLVRQKLFAHFLGNGLEAAAFSAATRIPNVLQNLLGEGVLSASLIPVYAGLRARGDEAGARKVAGAVFGLLSLLVSGMVVLGVLGAPWLVDLIAPGYEGHSRELTVTLVRLIFPGTGVLVLSAWCLGILNSHKKFFLSYAAPVVWNGCIIAALLVSRGQTQDTIVTWAAWGTVLGSAAQFLVQLPSVIRLLGSFSPKPSLDGEHVRQVVKGFAPAVMARGVVQVSSWVDMAYASLISERAVAALTYAQTIALLPVSLFGMAISAAELPEMSADAEKSKEERVDAIQKRLKGGLERMAFFVVPSAVAFLLFGDLIAAALLESGRFTADDSRFTWYLLMGSGVALSAQTSGRLYSSAFYALKDTKTPLKFAAIRVTLGIALGFWAVRILPGQLGLPQHLGAVFITVTTGVTAWVELTLLRRGLSRELGALPSARAQLAKVWPAALIAGAVTLAIKFALGQHFGTVNLTEFGGAYLAPVALPRIPTSLALLALFGGLYGVACIVFRVPQAQAIVGRVMKRR